MVLTITIFLILETKDFTYWHQVRRMAAATYTLGLNSSTHIYEYSQLNPCSVEYEPNKTTNTRKIIIMTAHQVVFVNVCKKFFKKNRVLCKVCGRYEKCISVMKHIIL